MKPRIIIKIGTSILTSGSEKISYGKIEDIAKQIVFLKDKYDIVIVSSGAIAAARQFTHLYDGSGNIGTKQALASIGQLKLMRIYDEIFENYGLHVSQCLMTYRDFENESSINNTQNTINMLLKNGYTPIINENDTIGVEEIILGDNDKLSALVAWVTNANLLVIASEIDGLYDTDPHLDSNARFIEEVTDLFDVYKYASDNKSEQGTGGMRSKLIAAEICKERGIEMWIVNGRQENFINNALNNKIRFTKFKI
jgi:glutamate 5-kinase